jgi:RND family efflux transporter MFP subunit
MPDKSQDNGPHDHGARDDLLRHTTPRNLKLAGIILLLVALAAAAGGIVSRVYADRQVENWTDDQAVPTVQVLKLTHAKSGGALSLAGDVQAFTTAQIYGQVSGYVKKWYVDIGGAVKQGQLLAEIDPRSYQAALSQAQGQLARDAATLANARVDLGRYQSLAAQNAISAQQLATAQTTVGAQAGIVQTDQAAVDQARINLGYTRIIAPFDGAVTSRNIDVGQLVIVGTPSGTPLFTVSDRSKLRVYVRVPQVYAGIIQPGMAAAFTVPEFPGKTFTAHLAASADAVSTQSGTLLVQFQIDNEDGALRPGDYAEVKLDLPVGSGGIRVPSTALIFRDEGLMVATVGADNHVVMKSIKLRQDMGAAVMVSSGLSLDDRVIDNPPDSLQAGDTVRVTPAGAGAATAG